MKPKRPVLLYLLVFLCLLGTLLSVLTMIGTIQTWNWFHTFSASLLPIYMIFKGFFLALGWLTAAFLLWKLYLWSIYFCAANAILTTIWLWVDRLILSQNPMPVSRHVFLMVINILLLVLFGLSFAAA